MDVLSAELFEQVVLKAFILGYDIIQTASSRPERQVYAALASVHSSWWRIAADKPRFDNAFKKNLSLVDDLRVKHQRKIEIKSGTVTGVTQLRNRIYVVCRKSAAILVYDADTFVRLDDMVVEAKDTPPLWPRDMAACDVSNCLYVTDINNYAIWRISNANQSRIWVTLQNEIYLLHLNVTSDGHVLLLGSKPPTLYIYSRNGNIERSVTLPVYIEEPHHAFANSSGHYIISHGDQKSGYHGVCEVTSDGDVIRWFGGERGGGLGRLSCPVHIALDESDRIFVSDYENDRVLVLDSQLNLHKVVLDKSNGGDADDERRPHRLCYLQDTRRLLIGRSGCVDVLKLTNYESIYSRQVQ